MVPGGTLVIPPPKRSFSVCGLFQNRSLQHCQTGGRAVVTCRDSDVVIEYHHSMISIIGDSVIVMEAENLDFKKKKKPSHNCLSLVILLQQLHSKWFMENYFDKGKISESHLLSGDLCTCQFGACYLSKNVFLMLLQWARNRSAETLPSAAPLQAPPSISHNISVAF